MKLLIQPGDGIAPLLEAIREAEESVLIVIFRFDEGEIERELKAAASRGVFVHALVAYTNRGGDKGLRKLEQRLLGEGITVSRTADDLLRYHDKLMIVDRKTLFLLAFNYTRLDIDSSRSFGIVTKNEDLVREAIRLFEADATRRPFDSRVDSFVVSPINARRRLTEFIGGAERQLLIYDPEISDPKIIQLLQERARNGVDIKIIGVLDEKRVGLMAHELPNMRLHTRTIIRDRRDAFVGSQSLNENELDSRREVGVIVHDRKVVKGMLAVFESDWAKVELAAAHENHKHDGEGPGAKALKRAVKAATRDFPQLEPIIHDAVKGAFLHDPEAVCDTEGMEEAVRVAVKKALKEVVVEAVNETKQSRGSQKTVRKKEDV